MFRNDINLSEYDQKKREIQTIDKNALATLPQIIDFMNFNLPKQQRFNIDYKGNIFECFYSPTQNSQKLYVFLSAANMTRQKINHQCSIELVGISGLMGTV